MNGYESEEILDINTKDGRTSIDQMRRCEELKTTYGTPECSEP